VLRRLIRRASRYGRIMGARDPFLYKLLPAVQEIFGHVYPEVKTAEKQIVEGLKFEEQGFIETLETGEKYLSDLMDKFPKGIPGKEAFSLYETYGFPFELTRELAEKKGVAVDEAGFEEARKAAQATAKAGWKDSGEQNAFLFQTAEEKLAPTIFKGYEAVELESTSIGLLDSAGNLTGALTAEEEGYAVLDATPFYAESGGQAGDRGELRGGGAIFSVEDTQKIQADVFGHHGVVSTGTLKKVGAGLNPCLDVTAAVDAAARARTARHHSATHLVH
jgi:alanyl-tRNA synthetase